MDTQTWAFDMLFMNTGTACNAHHDRGCRCSCHGVPPHQVPYTCKCHMLTCMCHELQVMCLLSESKLAPSCLSQGRHQSVQQLEVMTSLCTGCGILEQILDTGCLAHATRQREDTLGSRHRIADRVCSIDMGSFKSSALKAHVSTTWLP